MSSTQDQFSVTNSHVSKDYTTINLDREFHNEKAATYWLPKDDDEQRRLTGQHFAYKELFEGNILSSVRNILDFNKGVSILDIGCGSGVWMMDMSHDYPNCVYNGCDIIDAINKNMKFEKLTFNIGNVVKGLPYPDNTFDFVHMRFLIYALRTEEWPIAIKEAIRVVKPGGMLQFYEGGCSIPEDNSTPFHKLVSAFHSIAYVRGQDPLIVTRIESLISAVDNAKIIQTDYRRCNLSSGTSIAKKFIWDGLELTKAAIPYIGKTLGLDGVEESMNFLKELKSCMEQKDCYLDSIAISVQKL